MNSQNEHYTLQVKIIDRFFYPPPNLKRVNI